MFNKDSNNQVIIKGVISGEFCPREEAYGNYFETVISVPRLSGECDNLRLNLPEHIRAGKEIGDEIAILGQFRSRNVMEGTKSKLELIVFALSELDPESVDERSTNIVMLSGFICKPTTMRVTPFGREIADLLVAVNRGHKKSDYLPCIAWSTNARVSSELVVGDAIDIVGRIQSRKYQKKNFDGSVIQKTAYEVSITKISTPADREWVQASKLKDYFGGLLEKVAVKYNMS
ncbi:MAG: single-stranded DNA-binding protein [Clostridia bacterium]|nr:single-stranded DNA-binding protein [Clostridia bacterium]